MTQPEHSSHCPIDCPNRTQKQLGKGYSYLFATILTGFIGLQSFNIKATDKHWEISLSPVPTHTWLPGVALVASVLGLDTDKLAQAIGVILSGKKGE